MNGNQLNIFFRFAATNVFMWYKNSAKNMLYIHNSKGNSNDRTSLNASDHTLIIKNVQPEDEGNYVCRVMPNKIEMTAKLIVIPVNGGALEKPSAHIYASDGRDISDRSITLRQGERVEISCKGRPETTDIKWFCGGIRVASNDNLQIDGKRLIITNATRDQNRLYSCLIEGADGNNVGSTSVTINVQCKRLMT